MNDSHFMPEIGNFLRVLDDGILDAELHHLDAHPLNQSISLQVEQSFAMFMDPTSPKPQGKEAALSSLENLSLVETSLSKHYMLYLFSDQS
jgi:hypothetical protein